MVFSGFKDWVEIFKGGPQTDSNGDTHDGDALIDRAVSTFDPGTYEPPAVVGHPKTDDPAYAWVAGVKAEMQDGVKRLFAKFRQVVPEFEDAVRTGMFKKRSAAFYPDGRLRHVGFLGAAPPAVKGLANIRFADQDGGEILFSVDMTSEAAFTFADIEAAREQARQEITAEFAEKERRSRVDVWADGLVNEGYLPPAMESGFREFAGRLDDSEMITFAEGQPEQSLYGFFRDFWEKYNALRGPVISFSEIATKKRAVAGSASERIERIIQEKLRADKDKTYSLAFAEVQEEEPELIKLYETEINATGEIRRHGN